MAVILVTYDLKQPGRNYTPVHDYLKSFKSRCKQMESVWLLDTTQSTATIRDELERLIDKNDVVFVVRLRKEWATLRYKCASWLKESARNW